MAHQFPIIDTWKSYKELEKRFLGWLVKTASATEQDLESPSSMPRLKYIKRLTKVVIREKHKLPSNVREDLAQVISKRKEAAEWYRRYNQEDQGHMYYLHTLQRILQLFEDLISKDQNVALDDETDRKPQIDSEITNDEGVINNQFSSLKIESTHLSSSDSDSDGEKNSTGGSARNYRKPKAKKKKGKKGKKPKSGKIRKNEIEVPIDEQTMLLEVDESDSFDEYMRVYFFLKDTKAMRTYLLEQWSDYSIGLLSLANVSIVTDIAMVLFINSEQALLSNLPSDKQSYESIANIMCPDVNKLMQKVKKAGATDFNELMHLKDKSDDSQEHNAVVTTEDYLCYTTWLILSEWHKEFSVDQYQRNSNHRVVAQEENDKFTLKDKIDLNRNILHELLYEVWHLKKKMTASEDRNFIEDEFTKGIQEFLTTKQIPIWLVFAAQIMCDIRFALGKEVVHCHDEVILFSSHILQNLYDCFTMAGIHHLHDVEDATYQLYNDLCFHNLKDWMSPTLDPPVTEGEHGEMHPTPNSQKEHEKFSYLRRNPVMCGLMIFVSTIRYNDSGVRNAAFEPSTMSCIHLYNALRQESRKDLDEYPEWKDMEFLILMQSVDRLFARRDQPSNPRDYVVSYEKKIQKRGPRKRKLQHGSDLAKLYHSGVCTLKDCDHHGYSAESFLIATFSDKLDKLLSSLKNIFPGNQLSPGTVDDAPSNLSNDLEDLNQRMITDFLAKKKSKSTNVDFLRVMTRRIEKEALFLYFDWHGMYATCMYLLMKLREEFRSEIDRAPSGIPLNPKLSDLDKVAHFLLKRLGKSEGVRKDTVERLRKVFNRRFSGNLSGPGEEEHLVIKAVNSFLVKRPRYTVSRVEMELNRSWPYGCPRRSSASDTSQGAENLLIAALAIAAPFSLALPLADPEPAKGALATTRVPENQNIYAKPTWMSIPIIDPTKLSIFPTPAPTQNPEPVTTKGEQQDGQDHATKTVKGSEGGPAHRSQVSTTHVPKNPEAKGKGNGQRDVEELEDRDVEGLDLDWEIEGRLTDIRVDLEETAASGKPTGGFTGKPDPVPAPTATAKPTQHFTGKPDTEPAQTATAKPTQHFTGKPDGPEPTVTAKPTEHFTDKPDNPAQTATGKPTQHFTEKPDTLPTKTINTIEPIKTSVFFTDKPEGVPRTFTAMYGNGGQATSSSILVNTYGPVSSSVIVDPVPVGTGKPAGGRGS
ncbi:hypothetical protein BCON_0015g00050 [Botryotinia convoluta]|uniref:DUF6604 domain-containing protein n=1 Tax=Botryotinia convoluta TaxID=54673 RepID=A0A4Z1J2K5_9HELO|nr:hypothetical protein BCON_0015g00050 [Botryotinia convoluta]